MALKLEVGGIITISLNQMKSTSLYIIMGVLRGLLYKFIRPLC